MEKKLLKKVIASFLATTLLSLCIFSVLLYRHEKRTTAKSMDYLLDQVSTVYKEVESQVYDKMSMFASEYSQNLDMLNYMLSSDPVPRESAELALLAEQMKLSDIYLIDKNGCVLQSSSAELNGQNVQKNASTDSMFDLLDSSDSNEIAILIQSEPFFADIPAQDYFITRSKAAPLLMIGVDPEIYQNMAQEISFESFLEDTPTAKDTSLLILDCSTGAIIGRTIDNRHLTGLDRIEDPSKLETLKRSAEKGQFLELNGIRLFARAKSLDDHLLVCLTETRRIREVVAIQILFCSLILGCVAIVLILLIRLYFKKYVFTEFQIIEDSIASLIAGNQDVEFYARNNGEMGQMMSVLNDWKDDFTHKEEQISALTASLRNAVDASEHDSLTGLVNRYGFEKQIRKLLARGTSNGALLMIDVDNFKQLNDRLGHPEGDRALQFIAGYLRDEFRETDIVARPGGDEFSVFMKSSRRIDPLLLEAKLQKLITALPGLLPENWLACEISLSIGAAFVSESDTYEELYKRADEALYKAKNHGKHGYVIL